MKASGITKFSNKNWSASFSGDMNMPGPSAARSPRPVIQVNEDIHFLVDSNGLNNFPTLVPNEKSIELSRRTYSKKNPIARPHGELGPFPIHLPVKPKSSPAAKGNDELQKKRKSRNELIDPTPMKIPRKNFDPKIPKSNGNPTLSAKMASPRLARNRATPNGRPMSSSDSDSDVEIVAVKLFQPVTVQVSKAVHKSENSVSKMLGERMKKTSNTLQIGKKKSKFFSPEVNHNEILMNEADVAPTELFSDGRVSGSGNSLRWLSANGTIVGFNDSAPSLAPKNTVQYHPQPLHLPEMKLANQEKVTKRSRELEKLYKNLDEIAWTHEKSFKDLLRNPDYIRHSERRVVGREKNLRKPKVKTTTTTSKKVALACKKGKMPRVKPSALKPKFGKHVGVKKPTLVANPIKKKNGLKNKSLKLKQEAEDDSEVFYMLNPDVLKGGKMAAPAKSKPPPATKAVKTKVDKPKGKPECTPKIKTDSSKTKSGILKLKPDGPKSKPDVFKLSPDVKKLKSYVPIKKQLESPPSTSGLQRNGCGGHAKNVPGSSHSRPFGKSNDENGFHRFSSDMQVLRGYLDKSEDAYSAFQNASKLRVRLQPLEHTNLWTTEFYEEFRKHFLEQALKKAVENRDSDSSNLMYQELLDSFMTAQSGGSGGPSGRVRKRPHEEEALRSSVRQSEGAFRYKEIVVKKHPNYMQVVLVPNEGKQNSLTVEAMKELKEAFLLAKKDPNCRAVLINSSGNYFCTGIDLAPLVGSNKKQAAEDISNSVRDLVMTLGMFTKPVVAAVNGAALGFGVSLLTYCDVVLASDKATFCLPATKLGYIPEGGITYTLPQVVGCSVASEMFMQGRRITAEQACRYGLVSEVIWPNKLMNEVIPRLQTIISQPLQAMEATKTMVRCHLWDKLKGHVDRERRLLCEHWLGASCQSNIKTLLQTGWLLD